MTMNKQALGWSARLGYAVGDFGSNLYWQAIALFLYFFYTDVLNIPPAAAGIAFGIASVYDALADPVMGAIADRTRTRWGRYRPYMMFGAIPLALSFAAMFYVPALEGTALLVYVTAIHVLMRTFYTVVNIPYLALSASLTHDAGERATLAGLRMMFAACAGLTVALLLPKAVGALGGSQPYFWVAGAIGLLATLALLACVAGTRERHELAAPAEAGQGSVLGSAARDFLAFWGLLRRHGPLARVIGALVVVSVALTMFSKCLLYWFKYGLQRPDMAPVALLLPALMLIVCAPLWAWAARRWSKRNAWIAGSLIAGCGYLGFWLDAGTSVPAALAWVALAGVGVSSLAVSLWAMLPDTVEYIEWRGGARNAAKVAGFAVFAQKAALAVNALLLGLLLEQAGFVANAALSAGTLAGIKAAMCLVPLGGVLLSVLLLWRYPITPAFHARMLDELAARRAVPS